MENSLLYYCKHDRKHKERIELDYMTDTKEHSY